MLNLSDMEIRKPNSSFCWARCRRLSISLSVVRWFRFASLSESVLCYFSGFSVAVAKNSLSLFWCSGKRAGRTTVLPKHNKKPQAIGFADTWAKRYGYQWLNLRSKNEKN